MYEYKVTTQGTTNVLPQDHCWYCHSITVGIATGSLLVLPQDQCR
jgi:hypothetical protein